MTPYPGVEHSDAMEADYEMKESMLLLELPAPLGYYASNRWAVDCTIKNSLDPEAHYLQLGNLQTPYCVEITGLAPCYVS